MKTLTQEEQIAFLSNEQTLPADELTTGTCNTIFGRMIKPFSDGIDVIDLPGFRTLTEIFLDQLGLKHRAFVLHNEKFLFLACADEQTLILLGKNLYLYECQYSYEEGAIKSCKTAVINSPDLWLKFSGIIKPMIEELDKAFDAYIKNIEQRLEKAEEAQESLSDFRKKISYSDVK